MGQAMKLIANRKRYDTATAVKVHKVDGAMIDGTSEPATVTTLCRGAIQTDAYFLWERAGQVAGGENGPQSIKPLTLDEAIAWGADNMPAGKFTTEFGARITDV